MNQVNNQPSIAVVIAVYNGASTLQRCLDSILHQTYQSVELVVMDGGSTDGTVDILRSYGSSLTHWESSPDRGITHAWNKALAVVKSDWILFLGADDRLADKHSLTKAAENLAEQSDRLLAFGKVILSGGAWDATAVGKPWEWRKFRRRMSIPHQAAFHHRRLYERFGMYDEGFKLAADYEMLLRPRKSLSPWYFEDVVAVMDTGGVSMTRRHLVLREYARAQLRHRVASPFSILLWHLYFQARISLEKVLRSA